MAICSMYFNCSNANSYPSTNSNSLTSADLRAYTSTNSYTYTCYHFAANCDSKCYSNACPDPISTTQPTTRPMLDINQNENDSGDSLILGIIIVTAIIAVIFLALVFRRSP